jgi:hypothetical protein
MVENLEPWKAAFAELYHRPTLKRPDRQGLIQAWAKIAANGQLIDIIKSRQ